MVSLPDVPGVGVFARVSEWHCACSGAHTPAEVMLSRSENPLRYTSVVMKGRCSENESRRREGAADPTAPRHLSADCR